MRLGPILPERDAGATLLHVAECVGPTFQQTGPSVGQVAMLVRLAGCNLSCTYCQVPHTWDWSRYDPRLHSRRFSVEEIASWALGSTARLVVISGGEPLLQQPALAPLVVSLARAGRWVEIETNGTCGPDSTLAAATDLFVVSPRLSSLATGIPTVRRINPAALAAFVATDRAVFTFTVTHPSDLDEITELEHRHTLHPIFVAPATRSPGPAARPWLAEAALQRGWNVSPPLQTLLSQRH